LGDTETQRKWNVTIMAESETLFRHLPRGIEENKENPEEGEFVKTFQFILHI
jgi:hypothetical protein